MSTFRSHRLDTLIASDIRQMTRECERVHAINMGQGICDLPTPPLVQSGATAAIAERKNLYSPPEGILELREAIADKLSRDNEIAADANHEIVVTAGSTGAYAATLWGLLNPGDGILLFEPYYGYHLNCATMAGLNVQFASLKPPSFELNEEAICAAIKPDTRAMVICTPANPSGKMYSKQELTLLAKIAHRYDLLVITDEIYEHIRYDKRAHISPATIDGLWDRTITIMGLSKTFSITGWRLGYAVAPEPMAKTIATLNDIYYVCAPTPLQYGALNGLQSPQTFFDALSDGYQSKRDLFCSALTKAGLNPIIPQGAYYVLADVSRLGFTSAKQAAMTILEEANIASIPGSSFYQGDTGESLVRFCFAIEDELLHEAAYRISQFRN